jgi:hypothetical protein
MPVCPRVRSATAGLSEPAQRGGGPCYEFRSPGAGPLHESVTVRCSRGSSGWVPAGADLPGPRCFHRCCQMRTLSKSARGASAAMCVDHAAGPVGGQASMSGDKWWQLSQN